MFMQPDLQSYFVWQVGAVGRSDRPV